jgi:glycine cleavage system H protein
MNKVPADLRYTKTHEWVRVSGDSATIGITDHAQEALGDMVFVELPEVGKELTSNKECAVVESVKSASDVYAPLCGKVTENNEKVATTPALLNTDPYGEGWLFKVVISKKEELDTLMDAKAYEKYLQETAH